MIHRAHRRGPGFLAHPRALDEADSATLTRVFDRMFSTRAQPPGCQQLQLLHRQEVHRLRSSPPSWARQRCGHRSRQPQRGSLRRDLPHRRYGLITTYGLTSIVTDAGTYTLKSTATNDIGGSLQFSEAVKKVVNLVDGAPEPTSRRAFRVPPASRASPTAGEDTGDAFETHHGSDNWMSAIITDATSAVSSYSTAGAKAEAIEKTMMDSIAMQSIITDLEHASHSRAQRTLPPRRMPTGTPPRPSTSAPPTLAATPSTLVPTSAVPTTAR